MTAMCRLRALKYFLSVECDSITKIDTEKIVDDRLSAVLV